MKRSFDVYSGSHFVPHLLPNQMDINAPYQENLFLRLPLDVTKIIFDNLKADPHVSLVCKNWKALSPYSMLNQLKEAVIQNNLPALKAMLSALSCEEKQKFFITLVKWVIAFKKSSLELMQYLLTQKDFCEFATHWRDHKNRNLLLLALENENYDLAESILHAMPGLGMEKDRDGSNIYHYLTFGDGLNADKKKFFKKWYPVIPLNLDAFNNNMDTPLNYAWYIDEHKLAGVYLKALKWKAPYSYNRNHAKFLAHVWSIENSACTSIVPYLNNLQGTNSISAWLDDFYGYIEDFKKNKRWLKDHSISTFWPYKDNDDLLHYLFPLYDESDSAAHMISIVRYHNNLIICDRTTSYERSPVGEIIRIVKPGFKIFNLSSPISNEKFKNIVNNNNFKSSWELIDYLKKEYKMSLVDEIKQKGQPVGNCTWTNLKGAFLAGLYLQMKEHASYAKDAYKYAYEHYKLFINFVRDKSLKTYKKEVSASDPLVKAIELKACINHILEFVRSNKYTVDIESIQKIKNKLGYNDEKLQIIRNAMKLNIPELNESIKSFVYVHKLTTINV